MYLKNQGRRARIRWWRYVQIWSFSSLHCCDVVTWILDSVLIGRRIRKPAGEGGDAQIRKKWSDEAGGGWLTAGWSEELIGWRPLGSPSNSFIRAPWTAGVVHEAHWSPPPLQFTGTYPALPTQLAPAPAPRTAGIFRRQRRRLGRRSRGGG